MCLLEGAEEFARATASGMAAVSAALLCGIRAGDHVVAARALFGSCRWVVEKLMPQYGVETTLVDGTKMGGVGKKRRFAPNTKLFFLERARPQPDAGGSSISPPWRRSPIRSVPASLLDNVFATPLFQKGRWNSAPTSSSIRPPSTLTARAAAWAASSLSDKAWIDENLHDYYRHTGPALSALQRHGRS